MKKIVISSLAFLAGLAASAQYVPDRLNYQSLLTDHLGNPRVNVTATVRFRIYDQAEGGNLVWGETHSVTTSPRGLFSVVLGTGSALGEYTTAASLRGAFASGPSVQQRYLELQAISADGTPQSPILPRQRFLTVPYVFQANDGQEAAGNFTVSGALYANHVGMRAGRLVMTNSTPISVAGHLKVDGAGKPSVTARFTGSSSIHSTASDSLNVAGPLTANQSFVVSGAGTFQDGVTAANPTFNMGLHVKGGLRALGSYACLGTDLTSLPQRTALGDGFALVYLKTADWGDDDNLVVTVAANQFFLKHSADAGAAAKKGFYFAQTVCIPIGKGATWSAAFSGSQGCVDDGEKGL